MIREANAIIRRGTLLSTTTLPYWSRDGSRRLVRQHWVSPEHEDGWWSLEPQTEAPTAAR